LRHRVGLSSLYDDFYILDDIPHSNSVSGTSTPAPSDDEALGLQDAVVEEDGDRSVEPEDDGQEDGEEGEGDAVYDAYAGGEVTGMLGGEDRELDVGDMKEREYGVEHGEEEGNLGE